MITLLIVTVICLLIGNLAHQKYMYEEGKPQYSCEHEWEIIDELEVTQDGYTNRSQSLCCKECGKLEQVTL